MKNIFLVNQALIVGIDDYPGHMKLSGCANDAKQIAELLSRNDDGTTNFAINKALNIPDRNKLRCLVINLFSREADVALFYFSGHGYIGETGGYLVTPDFRPGDEGVSMEEILRYANESEIKNKVIVLDCCHSGAFGAPINMKGASFLRKGITIIAASRDNEVALQYKGSGLFTAHLIDALKGSASNFNGEITATGIYAYINQAIGIWGQRPVFKANVNSLPVLRKAKPIIFTDFFKKITTLFPEKESHLLADNYFDSGIEEPGFIESKALITELQKLNSFGLLSSENDSYSESGVKAESKIEYRLTELGKYYWELLRKE